MTKACGQRRMMTQVKNDDCQLFVPLSVFVLTIQVATFFVETEKAVPLL